MDDVGVIECAEHVDDAINGADVGEEGISKTGALGSTLDEAGDVDDLEPLVQNETWGMREYFFVEGERLQRHCMAGGGARVLEGS